MSINPIESQRVWAEVNLDNIAHNVSVIKKTISPGCKLMAVVKANAYGHGAVESAKVMLYNGADCLGVAICGEGIHLRQNNIHVPVVVFGYTPEAGLADIINHNLTQTVFNIEMVQSLSAKAVSLNKQALIHIKIDTGMSRLGFLPNKKSVDEIVEIFNMPNISVDGIYTHFATSDSIDKEFTYQQYNKYKYIIAELSASISNFRRLTRHVSNSGAILDCRDLDNDMVRSGILLYGLCPSAEVGTGNLNLKPAMTFKTRVSYVKELESGVSVGYSRRFFTKRPSVIATIPVGYADGYARAMAGGGRVLVGGEYAPVIGNICMDQFMIDITDIKKVKAGDEVVLIGEQNGRKITAGELAKIQKTINYEIVCSIGQRVPRIYIRNDIMIKEIKYI